ncbi:MAG: ribosome-associated translation inhibitor RaiA [Clostridiales bacterium]|nr:ribosome-associated translation inhibitor RaiA [Clostridiales bacterium]
MRTTISGKHLNITDAMRKMAQKKIGKLERYFEPETEAIIIMSMERDLRKAEITIPFNGIVLRGEEATEDMQKSVEMAVRKLEKQIHRYRTRLERRLREGAFRGAAPDEEAEEAESTRIVRTKRFNIKPQDIEEAAMQMRLLGHSFYVFRSAETNEINVLYQRQDGSLGLIEPD